MSSKAEQVARALNAERVEIKGEPVKEAAQRMGLSANNASVTLHRARKELRQQLETFCGECAAGACLDCDCGPEKTAGRAD